MGGVAMPVKAEVKSNINEGLMLSAWSEFVTAHSVAMPVL